MKTLTLATSIVLGALTCSADVASPAATTPSVPPIVIESGPHHRVWQTVTEAQTDSGLVRYTNSYEQIETGLNRFTDQGWVETNPAIELFQGGAIASNLQYRVTFSPNLNSSGAIDLVLPDGQKLTGAPIGLAYLDTTNSLTLATVQDCAGFIGGPNQNEVTYQNALTNYSADIKYVVERGRFAQELILKQRLPSPTDLGLSENALLVVITEWIAAPAPQIQSRVWQEAQAGQPALIDQSINLGLMEFIVGKGFAIGDGATPSSVNVAREWYQADGRTFLLEKVPWLQIAPDLAQLPPAQAGIPKRLPGKQAGALLAKNFPPPPGGRKTTAKPIQMAKSPLPQGRGYVLDYDLISSSTNKVLSSEKTFYVSGTVNLSLTTTLEGGCVVKYAKSASAQINITGAGAQLNCLTAPFKPCWLTASDDDSLGEKISGSSGNPSGTYANTALYLDAATSGSTFNLQHLRVAYANVGIYFNSSSYPTTPVHTLSHAQFTQSSTAISMANGDVRARNLLAWQVDAIFNDNGAPLRVENLTAHRINQLGWIYNNTLYLTNSLLVQVTNAPAYVGNYNVSTSDDTGVFQAVGGGAHYLPPGSAYRNAGTATITPSLLADLRSRTTYAPVVRSSDFTGFTLISSWTPRESAGIDLGYAYEPIDAAWTTLNLTNATLLLTNGAVVAIYGPKGTTLQSGAQFISEGYPTNLNRIVRSRAVQENAWSTNAATMSLFNIAAAPATAPQLFLRFTDIALLADSTARRHLLDAAQYRLTLGLQDSALRNVYLYVLPTDGSQTKNVALTNNLAQRVYFDVSQGYSGTSYPVNLQMRDNLFLNGTVNFTYVNSYGAWAIYDNLFDAVALTASVNDPYNYPIPNDYNGYLGTSQLSGGSHNKTIATRDFATGPLGTNYYPTNGTNLSQLIGAGSRSAAAAGLYHYTVRADQTKEAGAAQVAIGQHYVALDANNLPIDTDGDGLSDWQENPSGSGVYGAGDVADWQNAYTSTNGLNDLQNWELASNVQVNDPMQDIGTDQNTQNETAVIAFGQNVIAVYRDSNQSVPGNGQADFTCFEGPWYPPTVPQGDGWAVSRDGGVTFTDKGTFPVLSNVVVFVNSDSGGGTGYFVTTNMGDTADAKLARDNTSGTVYFAANSQRPSVYYPNGTNQAGRLYAPVWRSLNNGDSVGAPVNATAGSLTNQYWDDFIDGPFVVVDNFPGTGQGDVYLSFGWIHGQPDMFLCRSTNGGLDWQVIQQIANICGGNVFMTTNHEVCLGWQPTLDCAHRQQPYTNTLYIACSTNRGLSFYTTNVTHLPSNGGTNLFTRSITSPAKDLFAGGVPELAVNPANGYFYYAYYDKPATGTSRPNIYFRQLTNGVDWSDPIQVNVEPGGLATDQWQPAITVKPDGTKLFVAWYDRRDDPTNHSLIRMYGAFATLPITSTSAFATNFAISTVTFPPVFSGTHTSAGEYDPVYPPVLDPGVDCVPGWFIGNFSGYMGDYDRASSDNNYVYYTWGDNRYTATNHGVTRNQADVRFIRLSWPH